MKKLMSILVAVMMVVIACAAFAEGTPQPEAGKKFEGNWVIPGGLAQIVYEEKGYRVSLEIINEKGDGGSLWQYACTYDAEKDSLKSVNSSRADYTFDTDNGKVFAAATYEDFDDEKTVTEFTIDKDGFLTWKDGREDAGKGLKFASIGEFEGTWANEKEEVLTEIIWNGTTEDEMFYTVYVIRGKQDGEQYASYLLSGTYDAATGKLKAEGTCTMFTKNANGEYDTADDGETYEAIFSKTEDGRVLYETDNGIVLDPVQSSEG